MRDQDENMQFYQVQTKEMLLGPVTDLLSFKIEEKALECPALEDNPIY
jgi:hypothetical protein